MQMSFRVLKVLFLVLLSAVLILAYWLNSTLPVRSGELTLKGLTNPVSIQYDKWGIPHIFSDEDLDGFRALGFVHGQDRLFQMDLLRRVGKGELSALIGEKAIKVDRSFRTFGTHIVGKQRAQDLKQNHPHIAAKIEAYYSGVNQAIDTLATPIEYTLLGAQPEHFQLEDVYGISAYMAHSFLSGLTTDPLLTAIQQKVTPEHFAELVLDWPESKYVEVNDSAAEQTSQNQIAQENLLALADAGQTLSEALPFGTVHGSNGWAVKSSKISGELPLFANDPHMQFSVPAVWYEAQLTTKNRNIYGHFAAGVPFPLLMRSENRIHGLTMLQSDDADIISFKVNDEDENQILVEGQWETIQTRQESIPVKGREDQVFTVKTTSMGPIVNDLMDTDAQERFVFYWLFTHENNRIITMMHNTMEADRLAEMEAALSAHVSPGLNVIYADKQDNIAMWATGRFIKRQGNHSGKLVINGSEPNSLPLGYYDFSHNPKLVNPASGYVFSTNNPYPNSDPSFKHTGYYSPIYREIIADEALRNEDQWTVEKMKVLQTTSENSRWSNIKPYLLNALKVQSLTNIQAEALEYLTRWDGEYHGQSVAASVFERFYFYVFQELYLDEVGEELLPKFIKNGISDNSLYGLLQNPNARWWDRVNTESTETQQDILRSAFELSVASLENELGDDPSQWQWHETAGLTHPHPLGKIWPLNLLFNVGDFTVNGSKRALNNMIHTFTEDRIKITNGPSTRRIVDLADMKQGWNINPVGQSGRWLDEHYDSQSDLYHENGYRRSVMLDQTSESVLGSKLVLHP